MRFRKPLVSSDSSFDHPLNASQESSVIWSLGLLHYLSPKALVPAVPTYHGQPQGAAYGVTVLTLASSADDCHTVLQPDASSQATSGAAGGGSSGSGSGGGGGVSTQVGGVATMIVADRGTSLEVTSGPSVAYPNPPTGNRTLYVNGLEAPDIKVGPTLP